MPEFTSSFRRSATIAVALLLGGVAAAMPSPASAGFYSSWSCHTPTGRVASTEGWIFDSYDANPGAAQTADECAKAGRSNPFGALVARLREPPLFVDFARAGDFSYWAIRGPQGTTVQDAKLGLCGYVAPDSGARVSVGPANSWTAPRMLVVGPNGNSPGYLGCGTNGAELWRPNVPGATNYIDLNGLNTETLYVTAWCVTERCNPGADPYVRVEIAAAKIRFRDDHAPVVDRVAGTLASGSPENGSLSATYAAHDVGGGVYRAIVDVKVNQSGDWRTYTAAIIDRLGGRCAPAGETDDLHEFLWVLPCPPAVADARVALDTSQLPPGDHLVRAQVEDAAGNRTDIVPPRIVHIDDPDGGRPLGNLDPPAPNNGRGASTKAIVRLAREGRTVGYGRKLDVTGRLVDEHDRAIAGARVQVDWRRLIPRRGLRGAAWKALGKVTTDRAGRFVARVPTRMSRALRFSYKANLSQEGFTSATQFSLQVHAHVTVKAARRWVRNGHAAVFVGRVSGTPRGGVPLSLQAWVRGRGWTPARTEQPNPRTGAKGRFRVSYKFARTFQRVVYRFRLVVGEDSSFPFVQTGSRRINVVVRP